MALTTVNPAMIGQTSTGASSLTATGSAAASLVTAAGTALSVDSVGRMTIPYQPSFHVRLNNGAYIQTTPLQFNNVVFDVGSNFNTSTYRFTAPVAGKYAFMFVGYTKISASNGNCVFKFRVNSSDRQYSEFTAPTATTYLSVSVQAIFNLGVGDYVDIAYSGSQTYYGGNQETNFFGWFIG